VGKFKPATNVVIIICLSVLYGLLKYKMPESTDAAIVLGALLGFIQIEK